MKKHFLSLLLATVLLVCQSVGASAQYLVITDIVLSDQPTLAGYVAVPSAVLLSQPESTDPPCNVTRKIGGNNTYIFVKYERISASEVQKKVLWGVYVANFGGNWNKPGGKEWTSWELPKTVSGPIPPGALSSGTQVECSRMGMMVKYKTVGEVLTSKEGICKNLSVVIVDKFALHTATVRNDLANLKAIPGTNWVSTQGNIQAGCFNAMTYTVYANVKPLRD